MSYRVSVIDLGKVYVENSVKLLPGTGPGYKENCLNVNYLAFLTGRIYKKFNLLSALLLVKS